MTDTRTATPDRFAHPLWAEVMSAREAAHAKHGDNSIEAVAANDPRWLPILGEECGEVCGALTYDKDPASLRGELIDVLAVASAWVNAIDRAAGAGYLWAEVVAVRSSSGFVGQMVRAGAPGDDPRWPLALGSAFGGVCTALTYNADRAQDALIDVLAVASAWVAAIDRAALTS